MSGYAAEIDKLKIEMETLENVLSLSRCDSLGTRCIGNECGRFGKYCNQMALDADRVNGMLDKKKYQLFEIERKR